MLKIVVLISGGGTNLQAIIDSIESKHISNVEIIGVISNNKNAYGLVRAQMHHIPAMCIAPKEYITREDFNNALDRSIKEMQPDLIVLAGFLVAIPKQLIDSFKHRIINVHPSLIPSFCGVGNYGIKVHEYALQRGVKITGATVHYVDEGTDTGPIILQKPVDVRQNDTPETLQKRVMEEAEWIILPEAISLIANQQVRIENNKVILAK